jgi:hypothetical protein
MMKCPACNKGLKLINPSQGHEYICINEECPANKEARDMGFVGYFEFYGSQEEIDMQWPSRQSEVI